MKFRKILLIIPVLLSGCQLEIFDYSNITNMITSNALSATAATSNAVSVGAVNSTAPTSTVLSSYYDGIDTNLTGLNLKNALYGIIKDHTSVGYSGLWSKMALTDNKGNNIVWDIYSDIPGGTPSYTFNFGVDQCGSGGYQNEGDCFNREHIVPQSWFDENEPLKSDLFHVYPTDGKVNGWRSDYPFARVENTGSTIVTSNGSKLGNSITPGYSKKSFEPIDAYKGDIARSYFYMATRYPDTNWIKSSSEVFSNSNNLLFLAWFKNLLLDWHQMDPVSTKEINRNEAIYQIQKNRNPFIDNPNWAEAIWG